VFGDASARSTVVRTGTEETSRDLQLQDRRRHVPIDPTRAAPNEPTLGTQFDCGSQRGPPFNGIDEQLGDVPTVLRLEPLEVLAVEQHHGHERRASPTYLLSVVESGRRQSHVDSVGDAPTRRKGVDSGEGARDEDREPRISPRPLRDRREDRVKRGFPRDERPNRIAVERRQLEPRELSRRLRRERGQCMRREEEEEASFRSERLLLEGARELDDLALAAFVDDEDGVSVVVEEAHRRYELAN